MAGTEDVVLEALSEEAFAPFGCLIAGAATGSLGDRPVQDYWRLPFDLDGRPEFEVVRYRQQPWEFDQLERHLHVTESRVALGGGAAVLAVAPPTPLDDRSALPDPGGIRAFLLDGSSGVMFHRGTWHALDCYPVGAAYVDFAFITEAETVSELEGSPAIPSAPRTQLVDLASAFDLRCRIVDPTSLVPSIDPSPSRR